MKLKEWRFEKYLSEMDMKILVAKADKRSREQKKTVFFHHSNRLAAEKIENFMKRRAVKESIAAFPSAGHLHPQFCGPFTNIQGPKLIKVTGPIVRSQQQFPNRVARTITTGQIYHQSWAGRCIARRKYDHANLNRLQCTESLAKNLVLKKEYEEAEALYRKVANGYDEIHYTKKRLSAQFSIAQLLQMAGHMEDAVKLFPGTFMEQIECGFDTNLSSLSCTIAVLFWLVASYTKLGREEEWEMLTSRLLQIQHLIGPLGLLGSWGPLNNPVYCHGKVKDIYKSKELWRGPESIYTLQQGLCVAHDMYLTIWIADYYSGRGDFNTAERIFRCGLARLNSSSHSYESDYRRVKVFQQYAKHLHQQKDNIQSAAYLLSALEAIVPYYYDNEGPLDNEFINLMSQVWQEVGSERSALTIGLFQRARDLEALVVERRQRIQMILEPLPNIPAVGYSSTEPHYPSMDFVMPSRDCSAIPKVLSAITKQKLDNAIPEQ